MQNSGSNIDTPIHFAPLSLVRGGAYRYYEGTLVVRGSEGSYWGSKAYDTSYAYRLNFGSGGLNPQVTNYKGYGFSIRCTIR